MQFILGYNFVGAPRDVVVTPFDDDGVTALVLDCVGDVILFVAHVLDIHLFTRSMGSVHTNHQHVGAWMEKERLCYCMTLQFITAPPLCLSDLRMDVSINLFTTIARRKNVETFIHVYHLASSLLVVKDKCVNYILI